MLQEGIMHLNIFNVTCKIHFHFKIC